MPRGLSGAVRIGVMMFASGWVGALALHPDPLAAAPPQAGTPAPPAAPRTLSSPPAAVERQGAEPRCTVAVITEDVSTSDTYLSRMTFPAPTVPANQQPVCPPGAAEAAARQALAACKLHVANPENCVYADTDHMFDASTDMVDSSPPDSQCFSYNSKFIAIACRPGSQQANCNVACGATAAAATDAAGARCRTNHDGECALLNAVPVQAP